MTVLLAIVLSLLSFDDPKPQADVKEPKLRDEILARTKKDQDARFKLIKDGGAQPTREEIEVVKAIDTENRTWMKGVVEKHGWPGKSLVGEQAAHSAWLLVQHADADVPFQKKCLELIKTAVKDKEASGKDLAYLTDRVLAAEGKKQLYGTQLQQKDGKLVPRPVEDEANLDARRKEVGLQPMAEYIEMASKMYKLGGKPAPVPAVVESTVATGGNRIRQFAFDNDADSYFASEKNAKKDDQFTLMLDQEVELKSLTVTTGKGKDEATLTAGVLEVSADGKTFGKVATFEKGEAKLAAPLKNFRAVRVRVTEDLPHPLVVREIVLNTNPAVVTFKYPIEFTLDVADAPELREWAEKTVRVCERQYPLICTELASEGYRPPTQIRMALKNDYNGVAAAGGGRITGSVKYFKSHPDDVGAMVHETVHCVQNYRKRGLPGWLVEGIADYYRFWKYEPGKAGRLSPERARYDASYRITAAFLAFVTEKYDAKLVTKLNAALRTGTYEVAIWKELTGKTIEELNQEWRQSLVKK